MRLSGAFSLPPVQPACSQAEQSAFTGRNCCANRARKTPKLFKFITV